jgi:hypothetical protein
MGSSGKVAIFENALIHRGRLASLGSPPFLNLEISPRSQIPQTLDCSAYNMDTTSKKRKADPEQRSEGGNKKAKVSFFFFRTTLRINRRVSPRPQYSFLALQHH